MGVSIWLIPPPEANQPLQDLIAALSEQYDSPLFQPHITLMSLHPSSSLPPPSSILPPRADLPEEIPVQFLEVRVGKTFFQSVLIALRLPANGTLGKLYDQVLAWNTKKELQTESTKSPLVSQNTWRLSPDFPHVSIYYGDPGMDAKRAIVDELEKRGIVTYPAGEAAESRLCKVSNIAGFTVGEIWVVNTEGLPEEWEVLEKIQL